MLTVFSARPFEVGAILELDDDAAHHVHVRRARPGDPVRLVDGRGRIATGAIAAAGKRVTTVTLEGVVSAPRPQRLEMLVPVADRDRMLLAAEKMVELQATAWRPVYFSRSRSVSGRGEGDRFREKVAARMRSALEQSGGAWLPELHAELEATDAFANVADIGARYVLDAAGSPLARESLAGDAAVAVGPEGGLEDSELEAARAAGWSKVSLGSTTLRFETALIAAAAIIRAAQFSQGTR